MGSGEPPLVTIGIPTYNRAVALERALRSALDQDHDRIEVVVSDNASTDDTATVVERMAAADDRVRYRRASENRGATANINRVRAEARGDYFMWLGDDDRIDAGYVRRCLEVLQADPSAALVAGHVRYHAPDREFDGARVEVLADDGIRRVLDYYRAVGDNGIFYGLMRREVSDATPPMKNVMGNDHHLVATVAHRGHLRVVDDVMLHRSTGGATASLQRAARSAGMPRWHGEFPPLAFAWFAFADLAWASPVYAEVGRVRRVWVGLRAFAILVWRFVPQAVPKYAALCRERVRARLPRSSPRARCIRSGAAGGR